MYKQTRQLNPAFILRVRVRVRVRLRVRVGVRVSVRDRVRIRTRVRVRVRVRTRVRVRVRIRVKGSGTDAIFQERSTGAGVFLQDLLQSAQSLKDSEADSFGSRQFHRCR
jgi:hypothetical protein